MTLFFNALIACARVLPIAEVGTFRPRAPYEPITVGALAGIVMPPDADAAS